MASTITRPRRAIREANQGGTRPPWRGKSAVPLRPGFTRRACHDGPCPSRMHRVGIGRTAEVEQGMLRLHDNASSGNAYKARLLLAQLGQAYERLEYDIDRGATRTPEFMATKN